MQARAGVRSQAARVGGIIGPTIPPAFAGFLRAARVVAAGAADARGHVWATLLVGAPGFVVASQARVWVGAVPAPGDALRALLTRADAPNAAVPAAIGLTVIDLATRRRVRVNGTLADGTLADGTLGGGTGGFAVSVEEAYGNCPKYIQARTAAGGAEAHAFANVAGGATPERDGLGAAERAWIAGADTAFIASVGPGSVAGSEPGVRAGERADASHRGGAPGFMVAVDARRVLLPDYSGNTMFNTLGNLAVDPRVGLTVPDFATGRLLQLSGTASIDWRPEAAARFPGAERVVVIAVDRVREVAGALPTEWSPPSPSPFNPRVRTEPRAISARTSAVARRASTTSRSPRPSGGSVGPRARVPSTPPA